MARLLLYLSRWCSVRHADPGDPVDAWIATESTDPSLVTFDVPVLVWCSTPSTPPAREWAEMGTLVGTHLPGDGGAGLALTVPEPSVDASAVVYVGPLTRRQWRRRLALPAAMVVPVGSTAQPSIPRHLEPTALAVTAVAIGAGPAVLNAMAWGAPTITDAETAAHLCLGDAVRIAAAGDFVDAARDLAHDDAQMAYLSWRGRQLVERCYDLAGAAYRVAETAGLFSASDPSHGVLTCLSELWASPTTASSIIWAITS